MFGKPTPLARRKYAAIRKGGDPCGWHGAEFIDELTVSEHAWRAQYLASQQDSKHPEWAREYPVLRIATLALIEDSNKTVDAI